ncbi:MAG: hypothetical protein M3Q34_02905 [bacterium]|nr:hypothetical protein [bacterium]
MSKEGPNIGLSKEEQARIAQEEEDAQYLADYLATHLEPTPIIRECGPEIAEFKALVVSFENNHSLSELHSIIEISPELAIVFKYPDDVFDDRRIANDIEVYEKDNPAFAEIYKKDMAERRAIVNSLNSEDQRKLKIRLAARKDIKPILATLNTLKKETDIEDSDHKALFEEYIRLKKAVGISVKGKNIIDHDEYTNL